MQHLKTEGIVIKRINYQEADRILCVFTKRNGKLRVRANGVRKITSRRSPHVELLNHSLFSLYIGRGMPILTEVQVLEDYSPIKADLIRVGFAFHICELIDGLCPEDQENESVFSLLQETFLRLCEESDAFSVIHEFEVELLTLLGFWSREHVTKQVNTQQFIEHILERKLKSKQILKRFL